MTPFFIWYLNSPWKPGSNEWSFAGVKRILRQDMASGKVEKMSAGAFGAGGHFTTPTVTQKAGHPTSLSPVPASSHLFPFFGLFRLFVNLFLLVFSFAWIAVNCLNRFLLWVLWGSAVGLYLRVATRVQNRRVFVRNITKKTCFWESFSEGIFCYQSRLLCFEPFVSERCLFVVRLIFPCHPSPIAPPGSALLTAHTPQPMLSCKIAVRTLN